MKVSAAVTPTLFGYLIIQQCESINSKLYSIMFPTIVFFIISYLIGSMFMSVYGIATDAIL